MDIIDPFSKPEKNQIMLKRGFWALAAAAALLVLWALFLPADWEARFGIFGAPISFAARMPLIESFASTAGLPKGVVSGTLGLAAWLAPLFALYLFRWMVFARSPEGEWRLSLNTDVKISPVSGLLLWPLATAALLSLPWWLTPTPEKLRGEGPRLLNMMVVAMLDNRLWLGLGSGFWTLFFGTFVLLALLNFPLLIWAKLTGRKALAEDELTPEERRLRRLRLAKSMPT